ncbi:DNA-3-methyladenine glycosylase [Flavihumibacter profundi]|uniref:DNA-3-methyladenine glycosylase n=1 Tax=Flavihumibacter profundi TaxID=2716883 RepID=UPI001CC3D8FA|nr:DNA-3-methyladenine glycosylase [Flavihumibacter profundi]MBZ5858425.1 DNA-3-methyladenine glycosylase [Flavihumibacter profundi]
MMTKLDNSFFTRPDVLAIARDLIGKILVTQINGAYASGRIVETEAYNGVVDRASHAYMGRRTSRTEVMYQEGGIAYVYLCYGMHHLFNVVTNAEDIPHAVLIRAIEPMEGIGFMLQRMKKERLDFTVGRGPGNLSKAMGITTAYTGITLEKEISIWTDNRDEGEILASPRIGVDYAGEDAVLPYRFFISGNRFVSGRKR